MPLLVPLLLLVVMVVAPIRDLATLLLRVVADVEGAVVEAVAEVARKVDSVVPIRNNTPL